ncbi:hypothetical protein GFS24_08070 [Chitinophaga sp. SYP-B3965]|uniref:S41 family peptidase n=1 Tax=Chitinophaga sp. SYP-B3965 TaxID=2663120 RepID=UPI0012995CD3|nr:S41 family peptidase [Chitinophaga sp. SYP-B3965]MRG45067.1 hypothetical protein [Chitinophaga sp. SYP-B3965]
MKYNSLTFIALFLSLNMVKAQEKLFPQATLQEDFRILRSALETAHIGLYRYTSKPEMDSLMEAQYEKIDHPMREIDFFKLLSPIMCSIRDEHTFLLPSSDYWKNEIGQTIYTATASASKAKLFPFFISIINDRLFIDNNLSAEAEIPHGTEILMLNGKSSRQLLDALLPTIHTNGFVETFRYRNLEQFSLQQTYNRFMVHYAIFIGRPDTFNLTIRKPGSTGTQQVSTPALTSKEIYNHYWRRYSAINDEKKRHEIPVEFKAINTKTAYLRLSDFHDDPWRRYNLSYSTEYRNDFKYILDNNIQNLIIDLRGNEGGNLGIGIDILKYICTSPYQPYHYHECNNYRFPAFTKYMRDSTQLNRLPDSVFIKTVANTYRSNPMVATEVWSRPMQPVSVPYRNKLYVLINGATGSAASILATLIRVNRKDAIFIGEESGGDMEGPISGAGMDLILPNTKIRADIPFIKRVVNLNNFPYQKGRGIIPDHTVIPTSTDITNRTDTQLAFTLKIIGH